MEAPLTQLAQTRAVFLRHKLRHVMPDELFDILIGRHTDRRDTQQE